MQQHLLLAFKTSCWYSVLPFVTQTPIGYTFTFPPTVLHSLRFHVECHHVVLSKNEGIYTHLRPSQISELQLNLFDPEI